MKSLFEPSVNKEILDRIEQLNAGTPALWGKMDVAQMISHCQKPLLVSYGELDLKRSILGYLLGSIVKKTLMKDKPMGRNLPTHPKFIVKDDRDFQKEKEALLKLVARFSPDAITKKPHPIFGKMSNEEWDALQWKHLDHHLRQFGV